MARTALITGSNRGIGLALVREYLGRGDTVLATCRRPDRADDLRALQADAADRLQIVELDVNRDESAAAAADAAGRFVGRLDILINNAGVGSMPGEHTLETQHLEGFLDTFRTNTLGPLRITRAMLPLLRKGEAPRVVNISSGAGHITGKTDHRYYAYGASKAALNFVSRALAAELRPLGIIVIVMSPGWVRTDMGGTGASLSAAESAAGIARTTERLTINDTSLWFSYDGRRHETW